jgi:methanogenic corrinoid protein MtbC1
LDLELYTKAQRQIREFKSQLPANSVEDLAREVIRRMVERDAAMALEAPSGNQIEALCHLLLSEDDEAGAAFINSVRTAGASIDEVYLQYLARAARMLGEWWDKNQVSFTQVTLGTSRMYAIMRVLRHQFPIVTAADDRSAVFASVPGEKHILGVRMAADLFRKDGWEIDLKFAESHDALVSDIVRSDARLIGISAGGVHSLQALSRLVIALQIQQPAAALFVSGQAVEEAAEAISLIGVDGMASDIDTAKVLMDRLWTDLQAQ